MADDINISPEMIENLMNMLKDSNIRANTSNDSSLENNDSNNSSASFENLDFNTIAKLKSIMDSLNSKDNPNSNLLYSLKPYLRKSRQDKLDQYINMLKVAQISKMFKGDTK